jgi:hypothetical protein
MIMPLRNTPGRQPPWALPVIMALVLLQAAHFHDHEDFSTDTTEKSSGSWS